ncbi:TetR/AcrR family transcriptional regulator [Agromyces archimandritae]|uniref:TetR/AcrR family transcriptional regulator n=1 Tax=Agromyces archimandritae TaxID=2781962 RepID=A0A975FLX8_9MICO|nr:TetR/AcrR family transcriptional regulator [Agromyces archimandritae]QTX04893.1 TetR/AcrR family transcriptional regulator [Agromyces archimandritae]
MPRGDLILGSADGRRSIVRTEPAQRRSAQRLDALLDAAAAVIDEIGSERLTTQLVAERAGASIGTVYRYFPDRVAVLDGLRDRSVRRYRERLADAVGDAELANWWDVIDLAILTSIECYRREPGFRIVRTTVRERGEAGTAVIADRLAQLIETEFDVAEVDPDELRLRLDVVVEVVDGLVARAVDGDIVDDRVLDECRRIAHDTLADSLGQTRRASAA